MKAYVLHGIGDLRLEEVNLSVPAEQEVIVEVKAAGICGSDIPRIYRSGAYFYPLIPGHEFSGVVKSVGRKVDKAWEQKRVGVFPLIPCGECLPCRRKQYEMCRSYSYLGSRRDGGFAEYAAVPANNLLSLPDAVSFEAGAMLEPMAVAVHALRRARPEKSDVVAICGMGTIGLLLLMFLLDAGIRHVLVIGNKVFQKERILQMGVPEDNYCDGKEQDAAGWIAEKTGGRGVDVFFECVGKRETLTQAINGAAPGGRVQLVGNPASDMTLEKAVYWKILRNQLTVKGTWNSSFTHDPEDDWHYVLDRLAGKEIAPENFITHRFSFDALEQGFHMMRDKTEDYVKVMMRK